MPHVEDFLTGSRAVDVLWQRSSTTDSKLFYPSTSCSMALYRGDVSESLNRIDVVVLVCLHCARLSILVPIFCRAFLL